jgi:hypothetical protein
MTPAKRNLGLTLFSFALLYGCGYPGAPLPPALELAQPVSDLHATRQGETVTLTWTAPTLTTEGRNIRHTGASEICRSTQLRQCGTVVDKIPETRSQAGKPQTYTDQLPAPPPTATNASYLYSVRVLNSYDRSAGISNQVRVPAAPTLPPPANFRATLTADEVVLNWNAVAVPNNAPGLRFVYRVFRREGGSNASAVVGNLPVTGEQPPGMVDNSFAWEQTYNYRAAVVTIIPGANGLEQQVEGDLTPPVTIVAHDVFPPARPTGLQAVFSGPGEKRFIDLVWNPDTAPDLAGYNVYRHQDGTSPGKLNSEPVKSPAFRDDAVVPGQTYSYSVSAVDVHGNESAQSEAASETVPEQ